MAARSSTRREPQIELRRLTDDYCEFVLKNTDVSMANALRRIILVEVRRRLAVAAGSWGTRLAFAMADAAGGRVLLGLLHIATWVLRGAARCVDCHAAGAHHRGRAG